MKELSKKGKRLSERDAKRVRTMKERYTRKERQAIARKAGIASGTKFTSERSIEANKKRWAAHNAAKEAAAKKQKESDS